VKQLWLSDESELYAETPQNIIISTPHPTGEIAHEIVLSAPSLTSPVQTDLTPALCTVLNENGESLGTAKKVEGKFHLVQPPEGIGVYSLVQAFAGSKVKKHYLPVPDENDDPPIIYFEDLVPSNIFTWVDTQIAPITTAISTQGSPKYAPPTRLVFPVLESPDVSLSKDCSMKKSPSRKESLSKVSAGALAETDLMAVLSIGTSMSHESSPTSPASASHGSQNQGFIINLEDAENFNMYSASTPRASDHGDSASADNIAELIVTSPCKSGSGGNRGDQWIDPFWERVADIGAYSILHKHGLIDEQISGVHYFDPSAEQTLKLFECESPNEDQATRGILGKIHPEKMKNVRNLALDSRSLGDHSITERMYRLVLGNLESVLDVGHPQILNILTNLGGVLREQKKYKEAEQMYREVLVIRQMSLGKDQRDKFYTLHNLALVLRDQKRYEEAEHMYREALTGMQMTLGKCHTAILRTLHSLALVLHVQKRYKEAEHMYREALAGRYITLGKDHKDTLCTLHSLALVLHVQKRYKEAEHMYREALAGRHMTLGKDHKDTLRTLTRLASVLQYQERYEEAEHMYRENLAGQQKLVGTRHEDTLHIIHNIGLVMHAQLDYEEAEQLLREVLAIRREIIGNEHFDTLNSMYYLAKILYDRQEYEESERLYREVLAGSAKMLGQDYPGTVQARTGLEVVLQAQ
jgi:tetratricopeptide (TPR) repeat protein